jgi:hypothetical protein
MCAYCAEGLAAAVLSSHFIQPQTGCASGHHSEPILLLPACWVMDLLSTGASADLFVMCMGVPSLPTWKCCRCGLFSWASRRLSLRLEPA